MTGLYVTDQHPGYHGGWVICAPTGTILGRYGPGGGGYVRAVSQLAQSSDVLTAAADSLVAWESDPAITYLGVETGDFRIFDEWTWRQLPLPLLSQTVTAMGHDGAVVCGRVDALAIVGDMVKAKGVFHDGPAGETASDLCAKDMNRGVSVDMGAITAETEILEEDVDGWPLRWLTRYTTAEIAALTITPVPAFANARIKVVAASPAAVAASGPPQYGRRPNPRYGRPSLVAVGNGAKEKRRDRAFRGRPRPRSG